MRKRGRSSLTTEEGKQEADQTGLEEGAGTNAIDDFERERIREQAENSLISPGSILGHFGPIIVAVCSNPGKFLDADLQVSATLALTKLMCTGSKFW
jgi:hypothetical protein